MEYRGLRVLVEGVEGMINACSTSWAEKNTYRGGRMDGNAGKALKGEPVCEGRRLPRLKMTHGDLWAMISGGNGDGEGRGAWI